jgi:putative transposase
VVDTTMDGLSWLRKQVEQADTDLLREMVRVFAERLMAEEADVICGGAYGERSDERVNWRNGYRARPWDTRTGTIDLAVPKLREGNYFPDWLLEPRRRAERAFVQVVAECYVRGVSTRRVEGLVRHLGIERISKSRVSQMAVIVDEAGNEVADQLLDPIRELETPEEERYAVVLKRRDESGALPPVSFLFRSGEPALECRDHYRGFIGPHGRSIAG